MMSVKPLFLAMVLCFGSSSAQSDPTILSVGEFANDKFVFAVGVPSLSFKNSNNCTGAAVCRTSWRAADGSSLGTVVVSSGTCIPPSASFTCSFTSEVLQTIYNTSDTSTAQTTRVSVELNLDSSLVSTRTYTIKYCDSSSDVLGGNVDISSLSPLEYLDTSEVPCVAGFQTSVGGNVTVTCLSNASLNQTQSCNSITCDIVSADCEDCCSGTPGLTLNDTLSFNEQIQVICCEGFYAADSSINYTCNSSSTFSPKLTCNEVTTVIASTTTVIASTTTGDEDQRCDTGCIVLIILGAVFFTLSVVLIFYIVCKGLMKGNKVLFCIAVGILGIGFILWLTGVILSATQGTIAGTVLGAIGVVCLFASAVILIIISCKGPPKSDRYRRGSKT